MTTDLKVVRFSSMRGNVCDKDSGTICWRSSTVVVFALYQGKVEEGQFDYFPTGHRDIPGTNPVCVIVVGKIGAGNVTTSSSNGLSRRGAGWKIEKFSFTFLYFYYWAPNRSNEKGSQRGDGFYGYRLKLWPFYGNRVRLMSLHFCTINLFKWLTLLTTNG